MALSSSSLVATLEYVDEKTDTDLVFVNFHKFRHDRGKLAPLGSGPPFLFQVSIIDLGSNPNQFRLAKLVVVGMASACPTSPGVEQKCLLLL